MESDLSTCLRQLKTCLDTQQIPQARSIIDRITQLIVEKAEESEAETDFNLECMLTSANGLVAFLNKSFSSAKHFGKVIESTFELFRKTIEKHSPLMGKRMVVIVPIALRYIQSSSVPARSRELAALVLQDSVAYGCLQNETYAQLDQLPAELLLVFQQGKLPNRFQQNLYELLGQLAQNFPASIPEPDRVRDIFLNAAEKQLLEENYPSLVSLAGAVRGLDLFLVHFAPSENDRELRQRLYLLVKKLSIWEESRSERAVFRNALHVVGNHAPLFSWQLYADHVHWQTMLAGRWIKSSSQEDRDAGLKALYAFHGEVARVLSTPELAAERGREYPPKVDVLNQYVNYYRKLLSSATVDRLEIRIAIRGFGIMAGPCQQLAGESSISLNELLTIVLQRIEGICERSASSTADMLVYLPDFIQALSEILTHVQQLSTVQLVSVQTMTVALVRDFYHISTAHHELIVRSVVSMLENIGKLGGTTRHQLLDSVLLQGIVWSCTHALPFPAALPVPSSNVAAGDTTPKTDWKRDLVTYKNYLPLWQGLLEKAQSAHDSSLLPALYRAFMNTLLVIVEKLDLSTRKRTFQDDDGQHQELFFSDPNIDLLPTKPKDYHIFLNLVELYRDMLHGPQTPAAVRELFADWIRPYFERFVRQSLNRPLVSGFVKLIEMGLATAERIGYFRQQEAPSEDFRTTQMLLAFYLEQTIQRALYAIGELQLACLRFVLNAPVRLLVDFIEDKTRKQPLMVDVFRTAFRLGRSLLSIARAALYSLQRIVRFRYPPLRREIRERLLRQVLPLLEPFLRTRDSTQPPAQSLRLAKFKRHRTANVPAVKIERIKQQHRIEQSVDTSELVTFQLRILNFFADLQPNECCWLVVDELELERVHARENRGSSSSLTRWDADSGRSLELRLLCERGTRPCIKLDSIVGRVCELAVECSDRATKLAACELLHTIVLYLLGISYQDQLAGLWTQVCHHLLQLSCDTDLAVCQMFEPLLFQIIHFVTQPSKLGQQGTRALLDCLLDATSNVQHSSTIRDLSVRCLREFLQWTNRQCGGTHLSNDRRKIKCTLLEQLKTHALELNASHRYGSALAFNNLFRLLLQEDFHIVRYSFELMHSYAIGLIVTEQEQIGLSSEANGGSHGAIVEQYLLALDHLGKLFEQRKALFNGCSSDESAWSGRRQLIPTELGGGEMEHLVRWLFRQCAARQRLYRRKCMELFARLSKTVRDVATAEQFLAKQFTHEQIVSICLQADSLQGIERASTLESLRNEQTNPPIMNISLWLEYFLATVDMYCWLRREGLVVDELLQTLLSRILPAFRYFLRSVVNFTVQEIMSNIEPVESFQQRSYEQRMSADKFVRFDALKSAVVVQVVDMLVLLLTRHSEDTVCSAVVLELWQDQATIEFLLALLLKPHRLGQYCNFSIHHEVEGDRHLWAQLETLVLQLIERSSEPIGQRFTIALTEQLILVMEDVSERMRTLLIQRTIQAEDQKLAKGLRFIAKHLRNRTLLAGTAKDRRIPLAARKLLQDCYEAIGQESVCLVLSPSATRFGTIVLEAIFGLADSTGHGDDIDGLVEFVISCSLSEDMLQPNIRHGEHFLVCFGAAVYELFLQNPSNSLPTLFKALKPENFSFIVRFLCNLMDYSYRKQAANTDCLKCLVEMLLAGGWSPLLECSRLQSNQFGACDVQLIELMSSVAMICPFPLNEIHHRVGPTYGRWLTELIGSTRSELSIELKAKAIVLLPTLLGPNGAPEAESHWAEVENELESLQTKHFPLRSVEFPPNSPERIGYLNCLERLLDAMVISRSPLLLKAIIQMTAPDGDGHIAEAELRTAIERFFADQPHEMQCKRLLELWELFANHAYAPVVRETILRRYLCTALWHCRYDSIVHFYTRIIRALSHNTMVEINGRTGWALEHALIDRAASYRLVEHYAALLPKQILTGDNCPVAQELYGSAHDTLGAPVRGQRLIGDFSKRAHGVRRVALPTNDRTVAELFRKYQCAAYRALVALISNTNEDARMYSVLLFRESREKGEFLWRHLIDCSNEELYLEGTQEQEQLSRTFEKRVAIRREGGAGGDPAQRKPALKDPGLSVVMESSLSQQVFRFDMSHSVVLSAREVAQKDAAELAKRQQGTLSNVSLERTKINRHEIMATVCGCIRHMAATKVPLDSVVHFLVGSLADPGQQKNVRLFLAKVIDNCRNELEPHAALLIGSLMQLIVDGYIFRGLNPLVTDLIALVLEWNASDDARRSLREGATGEIASLASVLLRFIMKHACPQQSARKMAVLRLNLELIQEVIVQWHEALTVPAELLFEMVSHRQPTEDRSQLQLIAGLQLGTIVLLKGRGKLVPWMESTKQDYLRAVLRCLDLPDSTSFKSAALLLGHSLAHLYPDGFPEPEKQTGELETFHTECIAKLTSIQREYDRKFAEVLYETAKGFPSIADPFLSVLSYRFPSASVGEKRLYLELLLGGRLEKFNDELYRELASMELTLLLQDGELQLPTLHLLNRSLSLVRELEHLQQLVEPIGRVATEPSTPNEARAVAFEILIYIHEHRSAELSEECRTSVWRNLIRGLCGSHETEVGSSSIRGRILEYLTDSGKLPSDVKERFLFVLAQLYDPTVEAEFLGNAVALLLDPAIRCRESKDRLFLHEYLNADVKFCEYTIETAARQRHTMTLLTPMFAETSQQRQLQSFITGRGSQMEQLIRATQLGGLDSAAQKQLPFEPTQDPGRLTKGNETFAMPTQQHTLLFESSALQLNRRSQRTGSSTDTAAQQDRSFERLRKRILKDSATNRQQQTAWAVSRHYASQRQRTEQRRDSTSKVTLYRRYRLADYPDLQINLLAFLLPLQALCRRDTTCARQTFVAIFNGLVECLLVGDSEGRTGRMVGDEWDRFVGRLDEALNPILESTKACDPNLFGGLIELTLGKASGKFTLPPRTIASVAGTCNMLPMGALYLEAKLSDGAEFDDEPVRTAGSVSSEADHWLQLSTLYHALHEHSVMVGIFGEKLDSDPQLREAIELEALGRYGQAHRAYCELVMRVSRARVDERNFCYKSAFNCLLQLGQWDVLLDEIGNQVTNHEELWCDEWNQENLLPHYVHGNALLVLAGDEGGREFYRLLEQWLYMPQRERHIRQEFGEQLTALYLSAQDMVRARLFGEQTKRQFLDEWHCSGVLSELVRTECLLSVRKVIELVAYSELLERSTKELEQAAGGLVVSWNNAQPTVTDSLLTWDTLLAYRRFLLEQLETKCTREEEEREKSDSLTNVTQLSKLLFELELNLLDVAFEQDNVKFAGKIIARLRAFEACLREPQVDQVLRRKIARIRYDRVRVVEASAANLTSALLRGFKQLVKLNSQLMPLEQEAGIRGVKQRAWTEFFHHSETVRTMLKTSSDIIEQKDSSTLVELMQTAMNTSSKHLTEEPLSMGDRLRKFSMQCLQCGIDVLLDEGPSSSREGSSSANDSSMEQLADAHLRLARYCYDELDPARTAAEELPVERLLLTSLLPAIKYGSREARHLFPVLLQLRNLQNGVLGKEFHENACSVPSWNFLPWIPQLLSYMQIATPDRPLAPSGVEHFLDEVLMRLVQEYPMALYFPARLLLGELLQPGASVRSFVYQFRAALSFPVLDHFVTELYRVVMPETRLSNMIAELKRHLASVTDQPSYHTFIERLVPDVFPLDTNDLWRYGQAYRAALPLVERFRTLQSLHPVDDRGTILAKLQELETNLESMRPRTKTTRLQLEDLSPWLADYHSSGQRGSTTQLVEIPGQYGLDRGAPSPTQHVTIVKVMPDVVVYGTLRLPIQLTFRGSDGNEYRFLAKFGEDLRQDQRIQQLQREITHRLRWDQRCREQQLQLRTYDVVPILPNFGLFGWLEGTVAMSEIAKQAAPRYNPGDRGQAHVHHEFGRFLMSVSKQLDPSANDSFNPSSYNAPALYGMAAAFCMPDRLQSKFVELAQTIRGNTLKRALYDMAATPEAYYRLRMNFAKSLATMNVTCWVLGIGDRHLSNIVLERATGMLVGVDFGIAFGAGTRDLPIPELVPFRLTPQFVGVMEPMRLAGVLQKCHLYTLQCLRNCRTLLRACLEVFVREPTVDWLRAARQRMVEQPGESGRAEERRSDREWNPQVRVDTVLRKLNGANPKQLLTDELRFGVVAQQRDFLVGYLALVDAAAPACTEKVGRRATATISTELQTEMLLEMAIDSRLLGITYSGWYPWF